MTSHAINFPSGDEACLPVKLDKIAALLLSLVHPCRSLFPFDEKTSRNRYIFHLKISLFSSGRRVIYRRIGGDGSTAGALVFFFFFFFMFFLFWSKLARARSTPKDRGRVKPLCY